MESAIAIKDLHKAQTIIGADYSEYPNPLRGLLEYRKTAYRHREKVGSRGDLDALIEYCEKQIKQLLAL